MVLEIKQYLRPSGAVKWITSDEYEDLEPQAECLNEQGCTLEAEVLKTGEIAFTCFDEKSQENIAIEICPNNSPEDVKKSVRAMVLNGYARKMEMVGNGKKKEA